MIPFWWACCTAWQTGTNSSSRCRGVRWFWSQNSVIGHALDQFHHEVRAGPTAVAPPSNTLAMFGWSMIARACRSASKRATTCRVSMPGLSTFSATLRRTGCGLLGHEDHAEAALADLLQQLVRADDRAGAFGGGVVDRRPARSARRGGSRKLPELPVAAAAAPRRVPRGPRRRRRPRPGTRPGPRGRPLQGRDEDRLDLVSWSGHGRHPGGVVIAQCDSAGSTKLRSDEWRIFPGPSSSSAKSQARAYAQ